MLRQAAAAAALALAAVSCMSEREYQLRKQDLDAKRNWPATYQPVKIKGPLTLDRDSELIVTVPSQPYTPADIPNGQEIQARLASDVLHTGALLGGALYSIHKAGGSSSSHTTINNNAPEATAP